MKRAKPLKGWCVKDKNGVLIHDVHSRRDWAHQACCEKGDKIVRVVISEDASWKKK